MLGEGYRNPVLAIVAALNEEEGVGPTIAELHKYLHKPWIIVVDGKSRDRTVEIAKNLDADVLRQEGTGKGDAIATAIKQVATDVHYVVLTDGDYTYPAEYIPQMIRILNMNPRVGMVCGNRFAAHSDLQAMHGLFHFGNRFLAFTHNMLNGVEMQDPLTGLRVIRWEILRDWAPRSKSFDIEVELNHQVERKGYGIIEIPIRYRPRLGEKKLKLRHGFTIMRRILLETIY